MLIMAIDCPVSPADGAYDKAEMNHLLGFIALLSPFSLLPRSPPCHPSHPSEDFIQGREHNEKLNYTLQINQGSIFLKKSFLPVPSWFGGVALSAQSIPEHGFSISGQCHVPFPSTWPTKSPLPRHSQPPPCLTSQRCTRACGLHSHPCHGHCNASLLPGSWYIPPAVHPGLRGDSRSQLHPLPLRKSLQLPAEQAEPAALPLGSPMHKPSLSTWAWLYCRVGPAAPTDP